MKNILIIQGGGRPKGNTAQLCFLLIFLDCFSEAKGIYRAILLYCRRKY